ncbi:outer membrane beta-barrel protein [Niabella beijingensis]|uniref:outer membrane beta-barrel protein n=1 Tax=Niabella beijingensis TaxID=2872700 RepID=UPI001CBD9042|nr:outer membrane beta-barrel protein [Niabella beijingensis]MBZ4190494.1 PorT family protein [Niabella beijingensis]
MQQRLILTIVILLIFPLSGITQNTSTRFGIKGGINYSKLSAPKTTATAPDQHHWLMSYHMGIIVDIAMNEQAFLRMGLDWQGKGTKYENLLTKNGRAAPMYFELPLNFMLKKNAGRSDLYIGLGPYISYGIGGKNRYAALVANGTVFSEKITWNDHPPVAVQPGNGGYFRRFSWGANAVCGIEFSGKIALNLQYGYGLSNARPLADNYYQRELSAGIALFL